MFGSSEWRKVGRETRREKKEKKRRKRRDENIYLMVMMVERHY
jgi:hypothetical protein